MLDLGIGALSGTIPSELGKLSNLVILTISYTELSEEIPVEFGKLTRLRELRLEDNELAGSIPAELGDLRALKVIWLSGNRLTGPIPAELGNLTKVYDLLLTENQLSGPIPNEIGNMVKLTTLNVRDNRLTGPIPSSLGDLQALDWLRVGGNEFSGCIAARLLNIRGNDLGGLNLPTCDQEAIANADDCSNGVVVPDPVGNAELVVDCVVLVSGVVQLLGDGVVNWSPNEPITQWDGIVVTGTPKRVTKIALTDNSLSGSIPAEYGELSELTELVLGTQLSSGGRIRAQSRLRDTSPASRCESTDRRDTGVVATVDQARGAGARSQPVDG